MVRKLFYMRIFIYESFNMINKATQKSTLAIKRAKLIKINALTYKCSNQALVDDSISKYLNSTRNAVENILEMCKVVATLHELVVNNKIVESDLNYFCESVSLAKNSSTFRKYVCIGKRYDNFKKYIENLPSSYTILYEITTAPPEFFELLMQSGKVHQLISHRDVKVLLNKTPTSTASNKSTSSSAQITLKFIESYLTEDVKKLISDFYNDLRAISDIEIDVTDAKFLTQ
jgi:hypothetical protein